MPTLTIEMSESALRELKREARARLCKPENIAQAAVEDYVRQCMLYERKFRDARAEVERRLAAA